MSKRYMIAGYGCGNLGDECIGMGLQKALGEDIIRVLSFDKPKNSQEIHISALLREIEEGDCVIFGGGYNLRGDPSVAIMKEQMEILVEKGAEVSLRGSELHPYLSSIAIAEVLEIFAKCTYLEFRTRHSVSYAQFLTGFKRQVHFHRDYSFGVEGGLALAKNTIEFLSRDFKEKKLVGISLGGHLPSLYPLLARIVDTFQDSVQFIGLPHCKHTVSFERNNDQDALVEVDNLCKSTILIPEWEKLDPIILKGLYKAVDGVISGRLHSLLFCMDCLKPVFVWGGPRTDAVAASMDIIKPEYDPTMAVIVHEPNPLLIEDFINEKVLCKTL